MSLREISISDLGRIVTGKTPSTKNPAFFDGDYQFVTPSDLDWKTYYCQSTERTVTDDARKSHHNQFIPANAVMVTCIGNTIGKCGLSSGDCLTNQQINSIIPWNGIAPKFVYYLLVQNMEVIRGVGLGGGSATPILNKTSFSKVRLRVPPEPQWGAIASILSAYDDLIENNRRRIQLLEQAARLLYKEWFVHLRFPGHEHVKFTDGVPEGWKHGTVSDFYQTASGGTPSRKKPEYFTGDIPWVKTQELPNGFILDTEEHITEEAISNSAAKLFPKDTVLLALYGATIGELGILSTEATCNQACCAIMPQDERAHLIHAYLFFREYKKNLVSLSGGAAQNNISQQIVRDFPMTMPAATVARLFVDAIQPLFDQWLNLERQNRRLRSARDLLLPRLMNGKVAV